MRYDAFGKVTAEINPAVPSDWLDDRNMEQRFTSVTSARFPLRLWALLATVRLFSAYSMPDLRSVRAGAIGNL